jgi:polar amino acid transport system substrate-binding protein
MGIVFAVLFANLALAEQTVLLVGDPWPPYVIGELGEDATSGVAVEIVKKIFSQIEGAMVRFPLIPWKRALREVEEGQSDGIGMLLKTPERQVYMLYTDALLTGENLIWSAGGETAARFEWASVEDLRGLRIGITQGYSYGEILDRSFENGDVVAVSAPTVERLFEMLANGRVNLALANDAVGYSLARKYPESGILPSIRATNSETFYIGISRKSPAVKLMPMINREIERLRADGSIDRIVRGE